MPIYTKTGDKGQTALFGGTRVSKDDVQIRAYGAVDEFSSILGHVLIQNIDIDDAALITSVQHDLYSLMSFLCGASVKTDNLNSQVEVMENLIDATEKDLPKLTKFILPQGSREAVAFHLARTVCRRAEREVVAFVNSTTSLDSKIAESMLQYLNRLSDVLFVLARKYNKGKDEFA